MNVFRTGKIKIATKVALSFIAIVVFQGVLTQLVMYAILSRSNIDSFQNRMSTTLEGIDNYLTQVWEDLDNKVGLLSGQKNIIEYTEYRLKNLLARELSLFNTALNMDGIFIVVDNGRLLTADEQSHGLPEDLMLSIVTKAFRQGRQSFMYDNGEAMYLWSLGQIVRDEQVIGMIVARLAIDMDFINRLENITNSTAIIQFPEREIVTANLDVKKLRSLIAAASEMRPHEILISGDYLLGTMTLETLGTIGGRLVSVLDMQEANKTIQDYNGIAFLLTILVLSLALLLSILFYRQSFLRPYTALQEGVARIGDGDFSYPIQQTSGDEFGDLVDSVNRMRINLLNRDRELTALSSYNELILNNVRSGIITVDHDGQINTCNAVAATMVHIDGENSLPINLDQAGLPNEVKELIRQGIANEGYVTLKECRLVYEGREEILTVSTSPFSDGSGEELGLIAVIADVTQIKKLEEQLQVSRRLAAIGEMVAGVAHQLRNPLAIMKVSAEILRDNYGPELDTGTGQYRELTGMLVTEIDSLNYIIHNFLDFARPLHITRSFCDIGQMLDSALSLLSGGEAAKRRLRLDVMPQLSAQFLDKDMMEQVIRNLVQNALEASVEGEVLVRISSEQERLKIEVIDKGCGMDEKTLRNVFTPFFSKKDNGTGLGLSIVHRIILEHNGTINVKSSPGEGSVFTVFI